MRTRRSGPCRPGAQHGRRHGRHVAFGARPAQRGPAPGVQRAHLGLGRPLPGDRRGQLLGRPAQLVRRRLAQPPEWGFVATRICLVQPAHLRAGVDAEFLGELGAPAAGTPPTPHPSGRRGEASISCACGRSRSGCSATISVRFVEDCGAGEAEQPVDARLDRAKRCSSSRAVRRVRRWCPARPAPARATASAPQRISATPSRRAPRSASRCASAIPRVIAEQVELVVVDDDSGRPAPRDDDPLAVSPSRSRSADTLFWICLTAVPEARRPRWPRPASSSDHGVRRQQQRRQHPVVTDARQRQPTRSSRSPRPEHAELHAVPRRGPSIARSTWERTARGQVEDGCRHGCARHSTNRKGSSDAQAHLEGVDRPRRAGARNALVRVDDGRCDPSASADPLPTICFPDCQSRR